MDRLRQRLGSFTDMYTGSRQQGLLRPETRGGEARILFASMYWYGKETGIARGLKTYAATLRTSGGCHQSGFHAQLSSGRAYR